MRLGRGQKKPTKYVLKKLQKTKTLYGGDKFESHIIFHVRRYYSFDCFQTFKLQKPPLI